mmetsp:Transcript_22820/g.31882  ORF Transcript_22820/g.31882 Transcript_22820/m.31882 type:complete len:500 (-) Transcript_22820:728-2227(-)|eukprot:CAMPEP_0184480674 /NCGR_PEP_ID=MMETSP0113_2-20130426/2190_1 /TAXON_ID=91329 /ORGANISM="Norrisiella sphaerica, Strain BC52" /LENGTH=499 /DNA_ID=CAMNT_0026859311 /DNA_START=191 /DNA_END=1690 /DNA_ORIENTATION=-
MASDSKQASVSGVQASPPLSRYILRPVHTPRSGLLNSPLGPVKRNQRVAKTWTNVLFEASVKGLREGGMVVGTASIAPKLTPIEEDQPEGDQSWILVILACFMLFLTKTLQPIAMEWSLDDEGKYPYRPAIALLISRLMLVVVSMIPCIYHKETWSLQDVRQSVHYIGASACTVANAMSIFLTVLYLGAGDFAVLKNFNLPFTSLLVAFIGQVITLSQWGCVIIITLGMLIFRASVLTEGDFSIGICFVMLGVVASSFEGVLMQRAARVLSDVSFHKHSVYFHAHTSWINLLLVLAIDYDVIFTPPKGPFVGWDYKTLVAVITMVPVQFFKVAVVGLTNAIVVKLIIAATTISTYVLAIVLFDEQATVVQLLACMVVCTGITVYQLDGYTAKKLEKSSKASDTIELRCSPGALDTKTIVLDINATDLPSNFSDKVRNATTHEPPRNSASENTGNANNLPVNVDPNPRAGHVGGIPPIRKLTAVAGDEKESTAIEDVVVE